jgi:tetratricopeptide (TPR) repeat protein
MRILPLLAIGLLLGTASACTSAAHGPAALARLEAARETKPRSAAVHRSLGIAYYRAGRWTDARDELAAARRLDPKDGLAALYAGLAAEQLGDLAGAREAYSSYLVVGRTSRARHQLRERLAALTRRELTASTQSAIAREAELSAVAGPPTTIAVLPFRFTGSDSSLAPLGRGLAELVVVDLARAPQLTVLERARVQALVDEIALGDAGVADPATAARAGRILRAGRLVAGAITQLDAGVLRADAAVVDVPTTAAVGSAAADDRLSELFAMEKRLVLSLFDALGVTLTAEQRDLVMQRPTRSVAAFVAFSDGLLAEDRGDLAGAHDHFERALREDPGFSLAIQRQASAAQALGGEVLTTAAIEGTIEGTAEGAAADAAEQGRVAGIDDSPLGATLRDALGDVVATPIGDAARGGGAPSARDPLSSATGSDEPTGTPGRVVIIIRQPSTTGGQR